MTDGRYVTWDRWDAEHAALGARVVLLEQQLAQRTQRRKAGKWTLAAAVLSGIVFPLALTAILTLLHLGSLSRGGAGRCSLPSSPP